MQPSAPFFRKRGIELAKGWDAQFRRIVFSEELGNRALCAIKCDRSVCTHDIAPLVARRAERKGPKKIGSQLEALVRIARDCARDQQRNFTHLDIKLPTDVVDETVRVGGRGSMSKQDFVQRERGGGQMGREHRAASWLDRQRRFNFVVAIPRLLQENVNRLAKRCGPQYRLSMRLDEHLPQPALLKRTLERALELTAQLAEKFDGRIPVSGLVYRFGWQELARQKQFGSELGNAPLEKAERCRARGIFAGNERARQLLEPRVRSQYEDQCVGSRQGFGMQHQFAWKNESIFVSRRHHLEIDLGEAHLAESGGIELLSQRGETLEKRLFVGLGKYAGLRNTGMVRSSAAA